MKDVNAKRGIIVCSNGHTKAALIRAQQHISIKIISSDEIEDLDLNSWDNCLHNKCSKGLVLWDSAPGVIVDNVVTVQFTGKCDECGKFHVWCCGCGNKTVLEKEIDWQCACEGSWFWLTSTELDEDNSGYSGHGNYLILVLKNGIYEVVDRRPI